MQCYRSHIAKELLHLGYHVRGTVRDKAKGEVLRPALVGSSGSTLEIAVVDDIVAEDSFDEVVKGMVFTHYEIATTPFTDIIPKASRESYTLQI
jgi:uncharacterized protein YbjT (DUF2867 family)